LEHKQGNGLGSELYNVPVHRLTIEYRLPAKEGLFVLIAGITTGAATIAAKFINAASLKTINGPLQNVRLKPPSTLKTCPVIKEELTRKLATFATSSGDPIFCKGIFRLISSI